MKRKRTLIIPDVHEQLEVLLHIEHEMFPEAGRVVLLGDFFDKFGKKNQQRDVARWVKQALVRPDTDVLVGNHDASYFFVGRGWACSGYEPATADAIALELDGDDIRRFKVFVHVGPYLCSHAGFHPKTIHLADTDTCKLAIELALEGKQSPMWAVGRSRGGYASVGGPTWLDWNVEFVPMDQAQIVGHTYDRKHTVRTKASEHGIRSTCLDTGLHHVMWVDELTGLTEVVSLGLGE